MKKFSIVIIDDDDGNKKSLSFEQFYQLIYDKLLVEMGVYWSQNAQEGHLFNKQQCQNAFKRRMSTWIG